MSGLPEYNFPEFNAQAKRLREEGHDVWNPAEQFKGVTSHAREVYLKHDLNALTSLPFDAIAVLPDWWKSQGATIEVEVAKAIGLPVLNANTLEPATDGRVTAIAEHLVYGGRGEDYGHPHEDFTRWATGWQEILGIDVTPQQVALCMIWGKVARQIHKPKLDNLTDICGYALCHQRVDEHERRERNNLRVSVKPSVADK